MSSESFKVPLLPSAPTRITKKKDQGEVSSPINASKAPQSNEDKIDDESKPVEQEQKSPAELLKQKESLPLPYREPSWSCLPPDGKSVYSLEVLKDGVIAQKLQLSDKSFFVFGRRPSCDLQMEHPSLSRYHALLQYGKKDDEGEAGFHLFDLGSTHGSWHNKQRCFPKTYYRLKVGHTFKLGGSTRLLVLQGPEEDMEAESELGVTELQEKARIKALEKEKLKAEEDRKEKERKEEEEKETEEKGISWGMPEDAVEEDEENPDMAQNPFALPEVSNLELDDPKKTLRGWFEREGCDLPEYEVTEEGYATFKCRLELPVDGHDGRPAVAEITHKGKKKEAVAQCALQACRLLDGMGLLRKAKHDSRAKKNVKKWEEEDFYGSDDDEFLDRTGQIERKRAIRMRMAGKEAKQASATTTKALTHHELEEKLAKVREEMAAKEAEIENFRQAVALATVSDEEDLDAYMAMLKAGGAKDKAELSKAKLTLAELRKEAGKLEKLVAIARPTALPTLKTTDKPKMMVMVGKRKGGANSRVRIMAPSEKREKIVPERVDIGHLLDEKPEKEAEKARSPTPENEVTKEKTVVREEKPSLPEEKKPVEKASMKGPYLPDHIRLELQRELEDADQGKNDEESPEVAPKRRGDRGRKRKKEEEDTPSQDVVVGSGYNVSDPKYAVWMPPDNQSGDGRTSLNEKLGY